MILEQPNLENCFVHKSNFMFSLVHALKEQDAYWDVLINAYAANVI